VSGISNARQAIKFLATYKVISFVIGVLAYVVRNLIPYPLDASRFIGLPIAASVIDNALE
jgi:hypothetical protein